MANYESVKQDAFPALTQIGSTGIFYRKTGHLVEVYMDVPPTTLANGNNDFATLPSEVMPPRTITMVNSNVLSNITKYNLYIKTDGKVGANNTSGASMSSGGYITAHETYLV